MNCDDFVELVTAYLDGALTPTDEQRFVEHLAECNGCDCYLEQIHATVGALGALPTQGLAPEAPRPPACRVPQLAHSLNTVHEREGGRKRWHVYKRRP